MITFPFQSYSYLSFIYSSYPTTLEITSSILAFELEVKWQRFLKNLCRMQLSPTVATSASTRAQTLLISRSTCGNIREKSLSSAINVNTPAPRLVASRHICGLIRGRSLSTAHNVTFPAQQLVASKHTWGFTQGKIPLAAHNAMKPCSAGNLFQIFAAERVPSTKCLTHVRWCSPMEKGKRYRPWQDSNLQSSDQYEFTAYETL